VSLGIFGLVLLGVLAGVFLGTQARGRIVVTTLAAFMLGVVVAGSNGVLAEPSRRLVDTTRTALTSLGRSIGGSPSTDGSTPVGGSTPAGASAGGGASAGASTGGAGRR
jgi:hypothetical protein